MTRFLIDGQRPGERPAAETSEVSILPEPITPVSLGLPEGEVREVDEQDFVAAGGTWIKTVPGGLR